ncbi:protein of unknown function DUF1624 [Desulfovibrio sp. X2]|uniref:acyltransferase family protein n=1 Tax=Desulfovibrio sp. X2 TaxID=941449 RepID=UPI000358F2C7|nr:heparan-alpha-glucosaminide N-acetyltransferase domain-containing protein [Desulfovibrio sp. X2]EPR37209.1 protein of unknown function DUF1624 [Desulfovibrio sp. X2]
MPASSAPQKRLVSLDALRGLTILGMIMANNPGNYEFAYPPLTHAPWHGLHLADFVFPFFLFIVGASIAVSVRKNASPEDNAATVAHVLKRAAVLFVLGLVLNGFPDYDLATIRIPGVLQRIAVVYAAAALLHLSLKRRKILWIIAATLLGYWLVMALVPVPGVGHASLDKGTNLAAWLDRLLMRGHLWDYDAGWDPEGLLSTLPAVCIALIGLFPGLWAKGEIKCSAPRMFLWGVGLVLLGSAWNAWFPINKSLCTSSFVLVACGAGLMLLTLFRQVMDVHGLTAWARPLVVCGRNPLAIYCLSTLTEKGLHAVKLTDGPGTQIDLHYYLYRGGYSSWLPPHAASLAWACSACLLWLGVAWILNARKIFIKL